MRLALVISLLVGCGNDSGVEPDAMPEPQETPPRVIAGGGIGDGPIDGVVNLHVIDDATREPIANATVRVGTIDGVTDDGGLFVARDLSGPQTIVAKASGYRTDVWVGANGANVTINLVRANADTPASGTLMGSIANWSSLTVPAGHVKVGVATYSQSDALGEEANAIPQPDNQNLCFGDAACNFTLTARTGNVAAIAAIFDVDLNGTPNDFSDDTQTLIAWAAKTGIALDAGASQAVTLDLVPANMLQDVTVDFGTPPSSLTQLGSFVGIDAGADGTLPLLPLFQTPAAPTIRAPRPEAIASGATYRLTAFASNGATNPSQSIVLRRGLTGPTLGAGTWLAPPSGTPTRTGASWSASADATVHGLEYRQGATRIANITVFDATTEVTLPDLVTLPSGSVTADVQAIGAPGLDVTSFSLDADRDKLSMISSVTVELN